LCIRNPNAFRLWQFIDADAMDQVVQRLCSQIDARSERASSEPLDKIRSRPKAHFQYLFSLVSTELRKGVNERLIEVTIALDLFEVFLREFGSSSNLSIATLLVPKASDLILQTFCRRLHWVIHRNVSK